MRIVVATDGSPDAAAAAAFLGQLPLPAGSAIRVVAVLVPSRLPAGPVGDESFSAWIDLEPLYATEAAQLEETFRPAAARLERPGVEVTTELRRGGAAEEIIAAAEAFAADLVVVGATGVTGLKSFLVGSVARHVAHHAGRPVLIGRAARHGLGRAILAVDESEHAAHAAQLAGRFPLPEGCELVATHVVRPDRLPVGADQMDPEELHRLETRLRHERRAAAEALLQRVLAPLAESGRQVTPEVREGDPTQEILALAEERGADLIVAGVRGVSLVRGLVVGSVADRLLQHAPCSVLLVH